MRYSVRTSAITALCVSVLVGGCILSDYFYDPNRAYYHRLYLNMSFAEALLLVLVGAAAAFAGVMLVSYPCWAIWRLGAKALPFVGKGLASAHEWLSKE